MNIIEINLDDIETSRFTTKNAGCLILTKDSKLLLQNRGKNCFTFPGRISTFGGKIENAKTPGQALIRELNEELGASISDKEIVFIGALTEAITDHAELIYEYFWHDKYGKITGCYEESPCYFDDMEAALKQPELMEDVIWLLNQCHSKALIL